MSKLQALLAQHPEEKEEFDVIVDILNTGSIEQIKMLLDYIAELEDMIEQGTSREEMLQAIDWHNHYTEQMQYQGLLEEDETWWESVIEGQL